MKRIPLEVWKKVPVLPEYYEVSNLGRIRSLPYVDARGWRRSLKILKYSDAQVSIRHKWYAVAALILRAFVGPPPEELRRPVARHLDDNRENNEVGNLAWGSDQDNSNDALRNGRNFASFGHLGKPHSEETKKLISSLKKGVPTGRKMSASHKKVIWEGYRRRFPSRVKRSKLCRCGCGTFTKPGNTYIHGHTGGRKKYGS